MFDELYDKICNKSVKIGIIGMGYVGLPNAILYASHQYHVTGFDIDQQKLASLKKGVSYIEDVSSKELNSYLKSGKLEVTSDMKSLSEMDVIFIDVPTPIDKNKVPNLAFVEAAAESVVKYVNKGALVVLESTVYPTTTYEYLVKPLEQQGFKVGEDIFVAYSQERIDPNNKVYDISQIPKVIGGYTYNSAELLSHLIPQECHIVDNLETAELTKLYENTFRFVNIALANEFAKISEDLEIDIFELVDAAATKPFGFIPFYPNIGIGGHCIPVDPYYLSWFMKSRKVETPLIDMAGSINDSMMDYMMMKIFKVFNEHKLHLNESKIAIVGATYKADVNDIRMASVFDLTKELLSNHAEVSIFDDLAVGNKIHGIHVEKIDYSALKNYDAVIVLVNHSYLDLDRILEQANIIFDTKNAFKDFKNNNVISF